MIESTTPNQAKKAVAKVLSEHGLAYAKLSARTVNFGGLGYGSAVFVTPHGLKLPDPRLKDVKAALPDDVRLDVPQICPADTVVS